MKQNLIKTFPRIEEKNCLIETVELFFGIFDCPVEKKCRLQRDPNGIIQFGVENPRTKVIGFLAIDGCVISQKDNLERCDFAVFDNKCFCFVELKISSKGGKRKPKDQLLSTINHFKNKLNFSTKRIEAYCCQDEFIAPKPASLATKLDEMVEFEQQGISLFYGTKKRFT